MTLLQIQGEPQKLDIVWRPVARVLLLGTGVMGSVLLWWMSQWWWLPLPVVAAFVAYEVIFWLRGDRPVTLSLDADYLRLSDRRLDREMSVPFADIRAASISWRAAEDRQLDQAWLVLHGDRDVLFAARLRTGFRDWSAEHTDLVAASPVLGGNAGVLRALADRKLACRQMLLDPSGDALRHLLRRIPEPAWQTAAVRVWRGAQPQLDYLGLHEEAPDGVLQLRGRDYELHVDGEVYSGEIGVITAERSTREVALYAMPGAEGATSSLPVLVLGLAEGLVVAIPAPVAGQLGEPCDLEAHTLHTHLAEGAHLVWQLLWSRPVNELPTSLLEAVRESRAAVLRPAPALARLMHTSNSASGLDSVDRQGAATGEVG